MADFNAAGIAALAAQVTNVRWMAWLDLVGDTIRVTTAPYPLTFAGTGDADLDGFTFGTTAGLISVGEVTQKVGGSDSVTVFLSGLQGIDTATLNTIGTKSNFQGRTARLWMVILDPTTHAVVAIKDYYLGSMMTPRIAGSIAAQTIALEIESYLAVLADASNRTYLDAASFDSGDTSAAASIAAANGFTALGNIVASVQGASSYGKDGWTNTAIQ
ncbi:MAG: hypothetical protein ACRYG4_04170 [Janthinobacterium lividum]